MENTKQASAPARAPKVNSLGLDKNEYRGRPSTLCKGCGHDTISQRIINATWDLGIEQTQVIKLSGIGCSSKTPAYFLGQSHGFNGVHGRMPSVATGAVVANHNLTAIGVSGDGDSVSIGIGQFKHIMRRNVPMVYIVENNGVYGLTKGQFSATADRGQILRHAGVNDLLPLDVCIEALAANATFVARTFAGDAKQVETLLKAALNHRGIAVLDIISPCVTFNNHDTSTKSYAYGKEHQISLQLPTGPGWILFIDELNSAPQLVQAALYQLILDRKLGEYELPPDTIIIAAGNKETDRAVTTRMPSALANRFIHIEVQVDITDSIDWYLENGIRMEVIAFLRMRPNLLFDFDPKRNDKAFATPRSWHFVSDLLNSENGDPSETEIFHRLVGGTVGDAIATEFMGFLEVWKNLPNPDKVIADPVNSDIPTSPAVLFALCGALARKATDQNFSNIITFAERLRGEFMMALVLDAVKRNSKVAETKAYIAWASKNQSNMT